MIIETNKQVSRSFDADLKSAGLVFNSVSWSTRRTINGKVEKGHPRALIIPDLTDADIPAVQAVLDAHVPDFGHVDRKILETKAHASKRIGAIAPLWKQMNAARENPKDAIFSKIDVIRKKSNMIEAHLDTLTDAEAGAYDIENSPIWD